MPKKDLNLPGQFNSFPRGSKPPHYAPHAQRAISAMAKAARGAQRAIEAFSPPERNPAMHGYFREGTMSGPRSPAPPTQEPKGHKPVRSQGGYKAPEKVQDYDPYGNYYFALEITTPDGSFEVAHFQECTGLKNACAIFEIQEGGFNGGVHKLPGQSKWENIVLKYATSASTFLLEWRDAYLMDKFENRQRYSGSIALMDNSGKVLRRYEFTHAWPVAWEGPAFNAGASDLAVETLELAHDGITVKDTAWSKDIKIA